MKRTVILLILCAVVLCSCNGVTPFGNASFPSDAYENDITFLYYNDEEYCIVSLLEGNPKLSECKAAFNAGDGILFIIERHL